MADKKPTKEQYAKFKSRANDKSISAEARATFQKLVDKFKDEFETAEKDVEKVVEDKPKAKRGRKPSTSTATKRGRKPSAKKTEQSADDIAKAKAEIKKRTGKTEEECESIIEEYKALRTKAQTRKKAETKAKEDNVKRVTKLKKDNNVIEGTTEKTADAVIETNTKDIAEKIEKEISKVEDKVEKEETAKIKKEVEKQSPNKSATEKKKEVEKKVEEKVEKKVKEKTKVVVKKVIIDTTAMLSSIAESLGKFDKDSQKEFLMKLRSDIDKLLAKYMYGGDVSGATQQLDITQSNLSASSVNPSKFARGGGVKKYEYGGYNGWTNYATWVTNLEILDGVDWRDYTDGEPITKDMLEDFVNEAIAENNELAVSYAERFLSDVNYYEIAEHINENFDLEEEDDEEYARGGGVSFKPYGKTKGKFTITYIEEGKPQSETWESIEMARDRVRRLTKMSGVSNVKLDEFARGGRMRGSRPKYVRRNMRGMINQRRGM